MRDLTAVRGRVPKLADYISYSLAAAEYDLGAFEQAITDIEPLWNNVPPSPLTGEAALVAARAYKQLGKPAESIRLLRQYYSDLPHRLATRCSPRPTACPRIRHRPRHITRRCTTNTR